jgi:putative Ca2+/H+ antiporter (TMEM165/GDT1 family)
VAALMAALVAALLTQGTDRTAWLAARLGDRFASRGAVLAGLIIAVGTVNAVAVAGAALIAPRLTPEACALMLALALASAGAAALVRLKPPKVEDARAGALIASLAGALALGLGDRTQFIVFALALRTPLPAAAAVGATLGSMAIIVPAALAGERVWQRLPHRAIRFVVAGLLIVTGIIIGLGALRLT